MKPAETKLGSSFKWLNITQFLGAFNDNIFKLLIALLLIHLKGDENTATVMATAGAVFVLPFLLFSALAGKLADSVSKRNIIVATKIAELLLMAVGIVAFAINSPAVLYVVLFLMATQSAFFAPSKYGIVPELVQTTQLSRANGLLEAMTYAAIVLGTAAAFTLSWITGENFSLMGIGCILISIVGLVTSLLIRRTPPAGTQRKVSLFFLRDIFQTIRQIHRDKDLLLAVLASAYFLLIGGLIYLNLIPYGIKHLDLDSSQSSQLFLIVAIGIGIGALWAGKLSGRNVEFGVVPLGALGLTICSIGLALTDGSKPAAFALIFIMGMSGGLFIVPIHAFVQLRSPQKQRGQILAASNFLGWVGVLMASGFIYLFCDLLGLSAAGMFIVLAILTAVLTTITMVLLPDFLVRLLCILLARFCYKIKVTGIENVPTTKSALLVCNHTCWSDALLLAATQQRRIRFVMDRSFYNIWWLNPICRLMKAIPISSDDPPKKIIASLKQARSAMQDGSLVCIFAEGAMTRNSMMRPFRGGFQRIVKNSNYKIIPVYIGGAWGSIFSYRYGKPLSTLPGKFPYPVSIHFGQPMPADSSTQQIRQKVAELSCDYFNSLKPLRKSLASCFVQVVRKNFSKHCICDSTGKRLSYGRTLTAAIALSEQIEKKTIDQDKVAVMLPPSVAAVLANLAISILGKVPVNLNYTTSVDAVRNAVEQCNIKCIITSRIFIKKLTGFETIENLCFIEDVSADINSFDKIKAYLKARFMSRYFLTHAAGFSADDTATIIFSSGSTAAAKGIMLSHHNILSSIETMKMVFHIRPNDNVCGVLPLFHSFGYVCTMWLPLLSGVSAGYCPNPLNTGTVGKMAEENHSTVLFAAPTFLLNYARRIDPKTFASLREVFVGAEKLKKQIADAFERKFNIKVFEGYGATETSPVISINIKDAAIGNDYQTGYKQGTVGHPLPGIAVKVVDIETAKPLPTGCEGLLMAKGPNVMLGYLGMPQRTDEVIVDGWYNTGDVAKIDEDGFITITDRLSRFSKIAGEMVPHIAIEEIFYTALDSTEQLVAVTGITRTRKGEELVVLHTPQAGDTKKLHRIIKDSNLANTWKPSRKNYVSIPQLPMLGSGKLDIKKLKKIALDAKEKT